MTWTEFLNDQQNEVIVYDYHWDGEHRPTCYIDFLGQECRVGDYIVYATSQSSSCKVTMARILEFRTNDAQGEPYGRTIYDYDVAWQQGTPRPSHFQHQFNLRVQPLLDARYGRDNKTGVGPKAVSLSSLQNIHKVDVSQAEFEEYDGS